ncbi:MAG: glycosyltransferase family 9 protein [Deltaproteobacteria bacterium]|nr:glycosyltransferase family 9 protein [Deltaproteobacteria bacterium]MBI3293970.1 glycosyltransferase family 9 protein [Deltaproteobacteria bacterium]
MSASLQEPWYFYGVNLSNIFWQARRLSRAAGPLQTARLAARLSRHLPRLWRLKQSGRPLIVIALIERLGDLVSSEPLIRLIRDRHKEACILWCLEPHYSELLRHHPLLDGLIEVKSFTEWRSLATLFPFTKIYDLHPNLFPCRRFPGLLSKRHGDPRVTMRNYYHFPGGLLGAFSRAGGLPFEPRSPEISITRETKARVDKLRLPNAFWVVHTRSEDTQRDWRPSHWEKLIREVPLPVVEVGQRPVLPKSARSLSTLSILEQAEVIRRARFFVGVDSGPAHLAHAMRTPAVILLGTFLDFRRHNPYTGFYQGPPGALHVRVNGPCSEIPFSLVKEAVTKRMETLGCVSASTSIQNETVS